MYVKYVQVISFYLSASGYTTTVPVAYHKLTLGYPLDVHRGWGLDLGLPQISKLRGFHTFTDRTTEHPGSSFRDHQCCLRHHRVCIHRAGIQCGPWRTCISRGKLMFCPGRHGWKNDPYHSWKVPCSFRVATEYIREFRTRRMSVLIWGSRWLHGRNTVPSRSGTYHVSSVYSGTENCAGFIFYHGYAGAPRITPDACPVCTRWCRR